MKRVETSGLVALVLACTVAVMSCCAAATVPAVRPASNDSIKTVRVARDVEADAAKHRDKSSDDDGADLGQPPFLLLDRLAKQVKLPNVFGLYGPFVPRAHHAGVVGENESSCDVSSALNILLGPQSPACVLYPPHGPPTLV